MFIKIWKRILRRPTGKGLFIKKSLLGDKHITERTFKTDVIKEDGGFEFEMHGKV